MLRNPFVLNGYIGKEYFCDREHEVQKLLEHISNGVNVTLVSPRRVGKTGLIEHLFLRKRWRKTIILFSLTSMPQRLLRKWLPKWQSQSCQH